MAETADSGDRRQTGAQDWLRGLMIAAAAGAFLGVAGAFGSGEAPLARRLAYWVGLMVAGGLWGQFAAGQIERRGWLADRPWARGVLMVGAIAPPLVAAAWLVTAWTFDFPLRLRTLPGFALPVLAVTAAMTAINLAAGRPRQTHAAAPEAGPPRFLERVPLKLRGAELYAVEAEDHYLRVHTERGSDLILMRLSDAVVELEGIEGAQTHRSWWVARAAITGARRGDGRARLTLKNGVEVPVSRTHAKALRTAGWW